MVIGLLTFKKHCSGGMWDVSSQLAQVKGLQAGWCRWDVDHGF